MKRLLLCILSLMMAMTFFTSTAYATTKDTDIDVTTGTDGKITIGIGEDTSFSREEAYKNLTSNFKKVAVVITGVCAITSLICFLFCITKLGGAGDNERARQQAIMSILFSGIALMLFGGASVAIGFFWNAFG